MVRCKECKFWGDTTNNEYNWLEGLNNHKCCGSGKFIYDPDFFSYREQEIPLDAVGYSDGESCQAALWTGAEFGCIHGQGEGASVRSIPEWVCCKCKKKIIEREDFYPMFGGSTIFCKNCFLAGV